jgi:hypothetical protein
MAVASMTFERVFMVLALICLLPHIALFRRNTLIPIKAIISEPNQGQVRQLVRDWATGKLKEVQYVQVAVS